TGVADPEATQIQAGVGAATVIENSYPTMTGAPPVTVAPPKKNMLPLILAAVVVVFVLGAGAIIGLWLLKSGPIVGGPGTPTPQNPSPGTSTPTPPEEIYKPEFVMIPGGTFQMGRTGATMAEVPVHEVTVKPFYIDKNEITNAEYHEFVKETRYAAPSNWVGDKPIH